MSGIIIMACIFVAAPTIYGTVRRKYEVFGISVEPGQTPRVVEIKKFRTRKNAVKHYWSCRAKYTIASMWPV